MTDPAPPVAAAYCATFLKPEMNHVYRQITGLRRYRAVVLAQKRENPERFPFAAVHVLPRPALRWVRRWWQRAILRVPPRIGRGEADRIAAALGDLRADLLHVYFGHMGPYLLPLLRRRLLPTVLSFHGADVAVGFDRSAARQAMAEAIASVDLAVVRSESLARALAPFGCPPEKIRLHRTGIPLDRWPATERAAPADGAWHLVQACRLIEKKGLATTVRAFAAIARDFPSARLTIAGDGPLEADLRKLAADLGVGGRVVFPGMLDEDLLRRLYADAHLFLHPSETGRDGNVEGVPNSMLEAMATGLPTVATRHGGIGEAIEDGRSGLLVAERSPAELEAAMRRILRDDGLRERLSREATRAVRERFDRVKQIEVLEAIYDEARLLFGRRK